MNTQLSSEQISQLFFPPNEEKITLPEVTKSNSVINTQEQTILSDDTLNQDFQKARLSINSILDTSELALDRLMDVVKDTDSPRAFEVAATLISTISNASKDLLEVHERIRKLKQHSVTSQNPGNQTNIQNNIVFKGTSKDLLELVKTTT